MSILFSLLSFLLFFFFVIHTFLIVPCVSLVVVVLPLPLPLVLNVHFVLLVLLVILLLLYVLRVPYSVVPHVPLLVLLVFVVVLLLLSFLFFVIVLLDGILLVLFALILSSSCPLYSSCSYCFPFYLFSFSCLLQEFHNNIYLNRFTFKTRATTLKGNIFQELGTAQLDSGQRIQKLMKWTTNREEKNSNIMNDRTYLRISIPLIYKKVHPDLIKLPPLTNPSPVKQTKVYDTKTIKAFEEHSFLCFYDCSFTVPQLQRPMLAMNLNEVLCYTWSFHER